MLVPYLQNYRTSHTSWSIMTSDKNNIKNCLKCAMTTKKSCFPKQD